MENKKHKLNIDVIIGVILMLFSGIFLYESYKLNVIAGQFPKIIFTVLLIFSALLTLFGIRKTIHPELTLKSDTLLYDIKVIRTPLAVFAIVFVYIVLMKFIGFFIATLLFVPVIMLYFGIRSIRTIILTDILLNLFVYVFFVKVLNVILP